VSPRRYTLGARAAAVAETRARVVGAARQLLVEGDFRRVTVDEAARRADVARATVYHQFGSKLGLLEAVIKDLEGRAGLEALVALVERDPPRQLVRSVITAGCRYWATDPDLARRVIGLGSLQFDVHELLAGHDAGRLSILGRMVDRLADAGLLRQECSSDHALNVLWLLTSFDAFDLLVRGRNLPQEAAADTLVRLAEDQILARSS
jgi:AcrR family transcriptional regulator